MEEDGKEREGGVDVWLPPRCLAPEVAASFPVAVCMPNPWPDMNGGTSAAVDVVLPWPSPRMGVVLLGLERVWPGWLGSWEMQLTENSPLWYQTYTLVLAESHTCLILSRICFLHRFC
ncbi:uncharacterized protein [Elaeis guineensis]|uniref:uncharacterized protein isoform X1 n=1 Tax=Elaeis guineensis var. tenera TaxID=51953 RepID=UPI003C6D38F1